MANANNNAVTQAAVEAAYGTWQSPIAAEMVAKGALRLGQPSFLNGAIYWLEGRPAEGGRSALVKAEVKRSSQKPGQEPVQKPDRKPEREPDREPGDNSAVTAAAHDVTPAPTSVRSLVHEYGGGAYLATAIGAFYANFEDQRIYFLAGDKGAAVAVTDVFDPANSRRYADFCYDSGRKKLYCVLEKHNPGAKEPANLIVAIDINPGTISEPTVIAQGCDFYSAPRLSPDGKHLAYLCWNHPNMPWDGCELRLVTLEALDRKGAMISASSERHVAGGSSCSIFQPQWSPDNRLFFVTDESGYWQPRVISDLQSLKVEKIFADAKYDKCEFGQPLWSFGQATYALLSEKTAVFAVNDRGLWSLIRVDFDFRSGKHKISEIKSEFTEFSYLSGSGDEFVMLAASAVQPQSVVHVDLSGLQFSIIKSAASDVPSSSYLSVPEVIEFPTEGGLTAFAFFYPPTNSDCKAAADSLPPLVVKCHGGPTGAASSSLSLGIQYWTSRGYAVVDVNYGGSTGYGRAYRERLNGNWGVVDVADCRNCVEYLVKSGRVDGERVAITGGSAGGYTVLCALTFTDTFKAGASHYGIGDLEALARETHKFESRYEDNLVAPYPAGRDLYIERSPIHHVEQLNCPVIFFQGLDDKIVPPNQAEAMVDALKAKGIAVAYIAYEGESHGFRKSENIIKTIESEYYFFCRIFGIDAGGIGKIEIDNLD